MADEESLFPDLDLSELDEVELAETVASETKWTYVIDYRIRQMAINDDGRPKKTATYGEYLVQTALKILNTERFQYVVYDEEIGVERSEWANWEDVEIKRDIEEALTAHAEISKSEVLSMERDGQNMYLRIKLTGLAGETELEEAIEL
ncbi:DUF2634 domain-containing protein [Paenibacillus polymyxa]|uniref:DUF2634 domain-containing protein n=1 Tax=Paenibacillus polymyxa TaxID=1406 RepID=UPI00298CB05A|nr:DUF2634 domain-containing protein [Paenibacillus polymyxa]